MAQRKEALCRVVAFLWALVAAFLLQFALVVGFIWGIVDVLIQLISDRDVLMADSTPARVVRGFVLWPAKLLVFAFTGDGEMMWLPEY